MEICLLGVFSESKLAEGNSGLLLSDALIFYSVLDQTRIVLGQNSISDTSPTIGLYRWLDKSKLLEMSSWEQVDSWS